MIDSITDPNERVRSILFAAGLGGFLESVASSPNVSLASLSASGMSIFRSVFARSPHLPDLLLFFTAKFPEHEEVTVIFETGTFGLATTCRI